MNRQQQTMSPAQEAWFAYRKDYGSWDEPMLSQIHKHFIAGYKSANPYAEEASYISTYPVGVWHDFKSRRKLKNTLGYMRHQLKARNWRALRNCFNGYLAEWHYPPEGMVHYRCGKGWTRRAAIRSLGIHIATVNAPELSKDTP